MAQVTFEKLAMYEDKSPDYPEVQAICAGMAALYF